MSLYTDEDIQAGMAAEFALWESKNGYMPGAEESIPAILAAVAPAIAARALREAAVIHEGGGLVSCRAVNAWLNSRADDIEAGAA